jgi:ketosteroid isomerase-like protein
MEQREVIQAWVDAFNRADVAVLAAMYSENATNHQVAEEPVVGRAAIRDMFSSEFSRRRWCVSLTTSSKTVNGRSWSGAIRLAYGVADFFASSTT